MAAPDALLALELRTPRLTLRLPSEAELDSVARLAAAGIHPPDVMPFLVPWTDDAEDPGFGASFASFHRSLRTDWSPRAWSLELGVWAGEEIIGVQSINAVDFELGRSVNTGSWLGRRFQGQGYGTEMRAAVLDLAFTGLSATSARSGAFADNPASAAVSLKLGYVEIAADIAIVRGVPVRERRFELRRETWKSQVRPPVEIRGLEACRPAFGVAGAADPLPRRPDLA